MMIYVFWFDIPQAVMATHDARGHLAFGFYWVLFSFFDHYIQTSASTIPYQRVLLLTLSSACYVAVGATLPGGRVSRRVPVTHVCNQTGVDQIEG